MLQKGFLADRGALDVCSLGQDRRGPHPYPLLTLVVNDEDSYLWGAHCPGL